MEIGEASEGNFLSLWWVPGTSWSQFAHDFVLALLRRVLALIPGGKHD
jgi:hypothetical protein